MGYIQVEEVTLPLRFLLKTGHFITLLALAFDIDSVVSNMTGVNPSTAAESAMSDFNSTKKTVQGLTYASFACFAIEYITLFMGVSIFIRFFNLLYILAHGIGLILMILLQVDGWNVQAFIAFFTIFNASPAVLELSTLFFVSKFSFVQY